MKRSDVSLDEVQQLHRAGKLEEAQRGYLTLLQYNPQEVAVLHGLALLCAEMNDLTSAQQYLEQAIALKPDAMVLYLHLANILKANRLFQQAEAILQKVIQSNPDFAAAYNNLGTVYFAQDNWKDAIAAFRIAIDLQADYVDAYYNLGLALTKSSQNEEALTVYKALIEITPNHPGGRFQLGSLLMQRNQFKAAIDYFHSIEQEYPFHFETQSNLATCCLRLGYLNDAKTHYTKALELMPNDVQILFNLGVIHMQQGHTNEAIDFYSRALKIDPTIYEARNNLGVAFLSERDTGRALQQFQAALRLQPENAAIRHTIRILTKDKNVNVASPEYIQSLFDSYADHYDAHIVQTLHYQVPQLMHQLVSTTINLDTTKLDILDLGCGTGLCGSYFQAAARTLVGVDLSGEMLALAAKKNIYSELVQGEILAFLQTRKNEYDLILAGDVLVYYGDLEQIFAALAIALRPQGIFVFNVEIKEGEALYVMTETGRFAHQKQYLDALIAKYHFKQRVCQVATLRTQEQLPVSGYMYLIEI